ncbi:MAG: DoxX family membrane protein [Micrococcales bacterium]|nr:DoxX family membrane protein [Micrococcales bacterium]
MSLIRFAGRALLGGVLIADAIDALRHPEPHAKVIEPWLTKAAESVPNVPEDPVTCVKATAGSVIAGGALIAVGFGRRLGALAVAAVMAPTVALNIQEWMGQEDKDKAEPPKNLLMHAALLGGALIVLAGPKKKHVGKDAAAAKSKSKSGKCGKSSGRGCCKDAKAK